MGKGLYKQMRQMFIEQCEKDKLYAKNKKSRKILLELAMNGDVQAQKELKYRLGVFSIWNNQKQEMIRW